ncbi:MAG: FG-GAP-like repeat-containing protein [Candidatus Binatia bacterium]
MAAACGIFGIAALVWAAKPNETKPVASGTAAMVQRLAALSEAIAVPENTFDPRPWIATAEEGIAKGTVDVTRGAARRYGELLLQAGRTQDSIDHLRKLEELNVQNPKDFPPAFLPRLRRFLGVAYLRLGEEQNCVAHHNADSCLLPIREAGVHRHQEGARAAIAVYEKVLAEKPNDLAARWMVNVAYMIVGEYPDGVPKRWRIPPSAFESGYDIGRFRDVATEAGLAFPALSGGSILEDFDRDGDLDLMSSSMGVSDQMHFFRNEGDGRFADRTKEAGLTGLTGGLNMVQADYDNDGWTDVLVLRGAWFAALGNHPSSLLRNNGDGTFDDVTEAAGLLNLHPTQTGAWGDYDNDGFLDLFIGNEAGPAQRNAHSRLFRNRGDGTFVDVAKDVGISLLTYVKGATWGDYDNDGRLDLYVSILGAANVLFHNDGPDDSGRWRFRNATAEAGVAEPRQSFPTWFWDYDNDGWLDLYVASFPRAFPRGVAFAAAAESLGLPVAADRPRLYRNLGNGTFRDVAPEAGVGRVDYVMGANFGDVDNDGFLDFYLGTGAPEFDALVPNRMYRSVEGKRFQDVTSSGGFGHLQKGHAIAFGDVDNDGDQDVYADMGGAFLADVFQNALFENPGHGNHWVTLRLTGTRSNRSALGARIRLSVEGPEGKRDIYATVSTGGSFGASSLQQEIGLGRATKIRDLEVRWPRDGKTQTFRDLAVDRVLEIREGAAEPVPVPSKAFRLGGGTRVAHEDH